VIRAVVDPNVFVSAQISTSGPPAGIARAADDSAFELVISDLLLSELYDVLMRPRFRRYMTEGEVEDLVADLREKGIVATEGEIERAVPDDPKEDYLVALAHASNADYLVSGDPHLVEAKNQVSVPVLTPPTIRRTAEKRKPVKTTMDFLTERRQALITAAVTGQLEVAT
jgi:putative PIN family toxin of toxin-antitoxin system